MCAPEHPLQDALRQSPAAGAVWEHRLCQLRARERGRSVGSLFFWGDRTREVDFVRMSAGNWNF